jgi:hypothetical protein
MAILQMKTEFKLGTTVGPVCLPSGPNVMEDVDTTECYATGWGKPVTGRIHFFFKPTIYPILTSTELSYLCYSGEPFTGL